MTQILVTGASGNIGRHLVSALQQRGADFNVMSSKASAAGQPRTRVASFADVDALKNAFEGVDTLFVLLPLVPNKLALANNVAVAARQAGVKHIVRASAVGADVKSPASLASLQGCIDQLFEDSGIASTFLRPTGFMQNYVNYSVPMIKAGTVYGATRDAPHAVIDVRDIAEVAARVLTDPSAHAGRSYTLTGAQALTDTERLDILGDLLGRPIKFVPISAETARANMEKYNMPPVMIEWMNSLNELIGSGQQSRISPDAQAVLGRAPITFRQFASDHLAAWQ